MSGRELDWDPGGCPSYTCLRRLHMLVSVGVDMHLARQAAGIYIILFWRSAYEDDFHALRPGIGRNFGRRCFDVPGPAGRRPRRVCREKIGNKAADAPLQILFFIPGFMQSLPGSVATGRANGGHEGAEARADLLNCRSRGVEISWASRFSSEGSCRQQ